MIPGARSESSSSRQSPSSLMWDREISSVIPFFSYVKGFFHSKVFFFNPIPQNPPILKPRKGGFTPESRSIPTYYAGLYQRFKHLQTLPNKQHHEMGCVLLCTETENNGNPFFKNECDTCNPCEYMEFRKCESLVVPTPRHTLHLVYHRVPGAEGGLRTPYSGAIPPAAPPDPHRTHTLGTEVVPRIRCPGVPYKVSCPDHRTRSRSSHRNNRRISINNWK